MDQELKDFLNGKFAEVDGKFTAINGKFAEVDGKFTAINGKFAEINGKFTAMDGKFAELENRLVEKMRDMQSELLRGFESFSVGQTIRLRKLEADQSNLDASLRGRVEVVESRLLQIEMPLGKSSGT